MISWSWDPQASPHPINLHHFVAEVIDHLHGDAPSLRLGKRDGNVAVERFPGFLVDLSLERGLQALIGVVLAEEIGLAHEEALTVVVAIAFSSVQVLS